MQRDEFFWTSTINKATIVVNAAEGLLSNEAARDCTYTFSVNDNTLTLTGGEGTIGGTYELHRQEE